MACADSSTNTKNQRREGWGPALPSNTPLLTVDLPHFRTPFSSLTCPTAEHTTHHGHAPPWNTLFTMYLPHYGTPYSMRTCPTAEHPTHWGPVPPRNNLLTMDLPHRVTTYSPWTFPTDRQTLQLIEPISLGADP